MGAAHTTPLAGIALLIFVMAVTPGPNNLLMLRAGLARSLSAVLPPVAGVVLGGLALLLAARSGVGALLAALPRLREVLTVGGALAIAALGAGLAWRGSGSARAAPPREDAARPGVPTLFFLQLVNPKSWLLALTVTAAGAAGPGQAAVPLATLAALFILIPSLCLGGWAAAGALAARALPGARTNAWMERALGLALAASALVLVLHP